MTGTAVTGTAVTGTAVTGTAVTGSVTRGRRPAESGTRERGSATILVLGLASVLTAVGVLLAALGSVAVARHRAAVAADLSALAAATRSLDGPAAACADARQVAVAQAAVLTACTFVGELGDTVDVQVRVRPGGRVGALGSVSATARAGPASG